MGPVAGLILPEKLTTIQEYVFDVGTAAFNSLLLTVEDSAFCAQSTEFRFTFLPEAEAVYHSNGQEDSDLFFQAGDVLLSQTEEASKPDLVPDQGPEIPAGTAAFAAPGQRSD